VEAHRPCAVVVGAPVFVVYDKKSSGQAEMRRRPAATSGVDAVEMRA
jgi:hypothetical protein